MTEDDALIWIDFMTNRIFGWDIVMAIDPKTGKCDGRTRRCRAAGELMRDIQFNMPRFPDLLAAVMADRDVVAMWPEHMRAVVRFRIEHKVPRDWNEPTSDVYRAGRKETHGEDWPDWLIEHGKPAAIEDHPEFPARSDIYNAWRSDCDAGLPVEEVLARNAERKAGQHIFGGKRFPVVTGSTEKHL